MPYEIDEKNQTQKIDDDGERKLLANFSAKIDKETRYDDGKTSATVLTISGQQENEKLPPIEVPAEKFPSLAWVMPAWGVQAVIQPGQNTKDDLRTAIQLESKPTRETIYTHTGWTKVKSEPVYLHATGAITKDGNNKAFRVMLPPELKNFELKAAENPKNSVLATLEMLKLGPPEITWPLIAATIAPLLGPADFAVHITGRTGTFKSEIASICQSHYGSEMDARNLPGSWSSTANALEAQTFRAKNTLFCVDDFIPTGTSWQVRAYQKTADQLLRGQGNQAGRARLTDTSNLQTTMYPRGLILSTGEDTPDGHSIRARMFILEITPGDIDVGGLTKMQQLREQLPGTTAALAQNLAQNLTARCNAVKKEATTLRDTYVDVGHSRTPTTLGKLLATIHEFLNFANNIDAITDEIRRSLQTQAQKALITVANAQANYLIAADPCEAFCEAIRHMIAAHIGHLRTKDGGIPAGPEQLGWTREESKGDLPTYRSHGKCIGWISWDDDEIYIDATGAYGDIKRHAGGQITFTKQTMFKRLKDASLLTRVDDGRQRNTVRINCEGHPRQVLAMPLSQVLEIGEKPNAQR